MQWDASDNAGFSTGTPWLKAGKSYQTINVEQEKQAQSLPSTQELIRLGKNPLISEGDQGSLQG